jgi:ABC-type sugar transport system, periplasmic component
MRKSICRLVGFALLACLLLGSVASAESTYPIQTENSKLTFWLPIQPIASKYMASYNDHLIYKLISEKTGMDVEFINCAPADGGTQLGLLIAGGDLPDIMQIRGMYPGGAAAGVSEGVFLDLTPYLEEYAPDYYKAIRSSDLCYRLATSEDGRVYAFLTLKQTAPAFNRLVERQDVMDELGLTLPTTLADYEAHFAAMQTIDMAGILLDANGRTPMLMWPFGITNDWCLNEEGKVVFGQYTENYRDYLTTMNVWYEKGYIYKDFMSNMSDSEKQALLVNKLIGMLPIAVDLGNSLGVANGFDAAPLPYVRKEAVQSLHFETTYWDFVPEPSFGTTVIAADSKNIEAALQYMNYYYTKEGADLCNWGIKDVHYTEDSSGTKTFTDEVLKNPNMPLGDTQMNFKIHMTAKWSEADVVCNPNVVSNETALAKRMLYSDDATVDNAQTLPPFPMAAKASEERTSMYERYRNLHR